MYKQLTSEQRSQIAVLLTTKTSKKVIAEMLCVHVSTIYRETQRNGSPRSYNWKLAQSKCNSRKQRLHKRRSYSHEIRSYVHEKLNEFWSPKQIVGYMKKCGLETVSHETIYQDIRDDRKTGGTLWQYTRHKMKHRSRPVTSNYIPIPNRRDITERPTEADGTRFGDWEMDLIVGPLNKGAILTLTERLTNYSLAAKLPAGKCAVDVANTVCRLLSPYKQSLQTITTDNGPEFSRHDVITAKLGVKVFFARPYHSWEKGAIENYNKLLRQFIPKNTNLNGISDTQLKEYQYIINKRPREKLSFNSPKNVFFSYF